MVKPSPIMVDLERFTGLTTQRDQHYTEEGISFIKKLFELTYIALFSLHHHKNTDLIVGGSLAGTTPVSRIFVLQVINRKHKANSTK